MSEPIQNLSIKRNTDAVVTVSVESTITNDTLVGSDIRFCLYKQQFAVITDDTPVVTKTTDGDGGITIPASPPDLMEFDVAFRKADTSALDYGNYYFEATVTDEIGDRVGVICGMVAITISENNA